MRGIRSLLICLFAFPGLSMAGNPHIELVLSDRTLAGQSLAHDNSHCVLMTCDGRIETVALSGVKEFRKISSQFKPWNTTQFRHQLLTEFGPDYRVQASRHYLVCGQGSDLAHYADILEELYRSFYLHFRTRGFDITEPDMPQVVVLFPNYTAFAHYAKQDGVPASRQLRGYYSPQSNRIALWQDDQNIASTSSISLFSNAFGSISGDLTSTLIHEATHQAAFNLGLHSRISQTPRWIVEGLATNFEITENLRNSKRLAPIKRVNRERYVHFGNYSHTRRAELSLEDFLGSDQHFDITTLDAYSEAWALTFYLLEKRSRNYASYLKLVAERGELSNYTAEQRIADFRKAFGNDLHKLEREYLAFIDSLE